VLVVWECATRGKPVKGLSASLSEWITGDDLFGETPVFVTGRT